MKFSKKIAVDENGVKRIAAKLSDPIIIRNIKVVEVGDVDIHFDVSKAECGSLSRVDDLIVDKAKRSKMAWFGKELNDLTIQSAYRPSVQSGILRVRKSADSRSFDEDNQEIEAFPEVGSTTSIAVDLTAIELLKSSIESIYDLVQIRRVRTRASKRVVPTSLFENDEEVSSGGEDEFED